MDNILESSNINKEVISIIAAPVSDKRDALLITILLHPGVTDLNVLTEYADQIVNYMLS